LKYQTKHTKGEFETAVLVYFLRWLIVSLFLSFYLSVFLSSSPKIPNFRDPSWSPLSEDPYPPSSHLLLSGPETQAAPFVLVKGRKPAEGGGLI